MTNIKEEINNITHKLKVDVGSELETTLDKVRFDFEADLSELCNTLSSNLRMLISTAFWEIHDLRNDNL